MTVPYIRDVGQPYGRMIYLMVLFYSVYKNIEQNRIEPLNESQIL